MKTVRMSCSRASSGPEGSTAPGAELELDDAEADRYVERGLAEYVEKAKKKTAAAKSPAARREKRD